MKNIYESKSTSSQIALRSELTNIKRNKGETTTDFIKRVKDLHQQLVAVGYKMTDNELSTIIIHGLKEGYEGLVQGLIILRQKPSIDEMEQILRDEDQRQAAIKNMLRYQALALIYLLDDYHLCHRLC